MTPPDDNFARPASLVSSSYNLSRTYKSQRNSYLTMLSDGTQNVIDLTNDSDGDDQDREPLQLLRPPISAARSPSVSSMLATIRNQAPLPNGVTKTPSSSSTSSYRPNAPEVTKTLYIPAAMDRLGNGLGSADRPAKRMKVAGPEFNLSPLPSRGIQTFFETPTQSRATKMSQPKITTMQQPKTTTNITQPKTTTMAQLKTMTTQQLKTTTIAQPKTPTIAQPNTTAMQLPEITFMEPSKAQEIAEHAGGAPGMIVLEDYLRQVKAAGIGPSTPIFAREPARPTNNKTTSSTNARSTSHQGISTPQVQSSANSRPLPSRKLSSNSPSSTIPATQTHGPVSARKPSANAFTEEQNHFLIFLKEVKEYSWAEITKVYNAHLDFRKYPNLQNQYSSNLNKRDRSKDPAKLKLPAPFAAEAVIDWTTVHSLHPGPRFISGAAGLRNSYDAVKYTQDYPSDGEVVPRREPTRRAKRVDYGLANNAAWATVDELEMDDTGNGDSSGVTILPRSISPAEDTGIVSCTNMNGSDAPLPMNFEPEDARLAILSQNRGNGNASQTLPYLSFSQRSAITSPQNEHWDWSISASQDWKGSLLHVDFSLGEVEKVKALVTALRKNRASRHSTTRRRLRELLEHTTEPQILQLISDLQLRLPSRNRSSIAAFMEDARMGKVADAPQVQRLAAVKQNALMKSNQKPSLFSTLRQRQLGQQSRRGWHTASRSLTYSFKNTIADTLGPALSWTGASSDVHTIAWDVNGERFAAGSVAVSDTASMQFNRPNNLLFGDVHNRTIHELGSHTKLRYKPDSGDNSSHAMFASQDPNLYLTVSSVAFSSSGKTMYSAGYDETICVWDINDQQKQPDLGAKIRIKAKIDILSVSRNHPGVLATAAQRTDSKAIRLLSINEDNPADFTRQCYRSDKAVERADLKILPTALQFEPNHGTLLLAGFGGEVEDKGVYKFGDICLWDVETQDKLQLYGSGKHVFDVEFNPNRYRGPLFAVGCAATGNRGTRSELRLYDSLSPGKFRSVLELECKALDMNDVVWCPHDEHLIAAGCTDGRAYVWDIRSRAEPLRILPHGQSITPLAHGEHREVSDTGVRFLSWGENVTRFCSGSSDGVVKVWDVTRSVEDTFIQDMITCNSGIMSGAFSPDMSRLALGEVDGTVNVLEVWREDFAPKDAGKLRYVPYLDKTSQSAQAVTAYAESSTNDDSGIVEGNRLLSTGQLQLAPMGGLPVRQVVQGPSYAGPYDRKDDAPCLRQQALERQVSMAKEQGPQCDIPACKDSSFLKITNDEIGDSGRSEDRIPDELRRQRISLGTKAKVLVGKTKCAHCGQPARPNSFDPSAAYCERCSFACFRCGADNPIGADTTKFICDSCAGVWDIGVLGYECIAHPIAVRKATDVPSLSKKFMEAAYLQEATDNNSSFGDEMNALTDHYFSLAINRPESPPL